MSQHRFYSSLLALLLSSTTPAIAQEFLTKTGTDGATAEAGEALTGLMLVLENAASVGGNGFVLQGGAGGASDDAAGGTVGANGVRTEMGASEGQLGEIAAEAGGGGDVAGNSVSIEADLTTGAAGIALQGGAGGASGQNGAGGVGGVGYVPTTLREISPTSIFAAFIFPSVGAGGDGAMGQTRDSSTIRSGGAVRDNQITTSANLTTGGDAIALTGGDGGAGSAGGNGGAGGQWPAQFSIAFES